MDLRRTTGLIAACAIMAFAALADAQPRGRDRSDAPAVPQGQARDEDLRWRMPLEEKADTILANTFRHNWFVGTYRPAMEIDAVTDLPNHTTTGNGSDMHTSTWTGSFLMGAAFRYGWAMEHGTAADKADALNLGGAMVNGIYILSHVSPYPGMIAREVVAGHGPAVEERGGANERNEWWQGVGKFRDYRYRANPSHHNYHHVIRGLSYWYWFLNKYNPTPTGRVKAQMDSVKLTLGDIMNHGYKAHDGVVMDADGTSSASLYRVPTPGAPDPTGRGARPGTSLIMATNCLKFGAWILGDPWYARKYDELTRAYKYRESREELRANMGHGRDRSRLLMTDWDDSEHCLGSLWLAQQIETDPALKEFYQLASATLYETKKDDNRSFFNYMYVGATGDRAGANLPGALESLQLYPSKTFFYPIMNSIRTDIETTAGEDGGAVTNRVLPFNEQPMDNSSDWKNNPYQMDGWMARQVSGFAVSNEDSVVWFLAAGGQLLRSLDGGRTFAVHETPQGAGVQDVIFASDRSRAAILATNKGIYWTQTGGYGNRWTHVPLGSETNAVRKLVADPTNKNVVWAIADDGIWKSVDLGREEVGKAWNKVSGPMPATNDVLFKGVTYGVAPGPNPVFYAVLDGRIYRRGMNDIDWTASPVDLEGYHRIPDPIEIAISPRDPNTMLALFTVTSWGNPSSTVLRTTDGGKTFTVVGSGRRMSSAPSPYQFAGDGLERTELTGLVIDPANPQYVYASSPRGFYRSTDGGTNWALANEGLRIPRVHEVFAPRQIPGTIFASTPAGFQISRNRGQSWQRPLIWLNGNGVNRTDRGGYGYLVAYWAGRYFGCISDAEATVAPTATTTAR